MDTQTKKQALKKKPYITPMNFIRGDELMVKRYNNLASILYLNISMNDLIENYFHGKSIIYMIQKPIYYNIQVILKNY